MLSRPYKLHQSMMNDYLRCPRFFKYRYIEEKPARQTGEMFLGSVVHETLATAAKMNFNIQEALEYFETAFEVGLDKLAPLPRYPGVMLEDGKELISKYLSSFALDNVAVELYLEKQIDNFYLAGTIDRIASDGTIIDYKIMSKPKYEAIDIQSILYAILADVSWFEYHVFVRSKVPQIQVVQLEVSEKLKSWFLDEICRPVVKALDNDIYPANPTSWTCNKSRCAFYDICREGK